MTVKILLLCIAIGGICGIADGVVSTVLRRKHIVFTVISDVLLAAVLVGLHVLVSYLYCDGIFYPYAILGQVVGFILLRVAAAKLTLKIAAALSPKVIKLRQMRAERSQERKRKKKEKAEKARVQTLA